MVGPVKLLIVCDLIVIDSRLSRRSWRSVGSLSSTKWSFPFPPSPTDPVLDASDGFFVAVFERRNLSKSWSQ